MQLWKPPRKRVSVSTILVLVDPVLESEVIANLEKHEGREPCPYLDTANPPVVSCGCGHALFTSQSAAALPFRRTFDGELADAATVTTVWAGLKYQAYPPMVHSNATIFLNDSDIDAIMISDLWHFDPTMYSTFPEFNSYPITARVALYDMIFQCGSFGGWPHLKAAVLAKNWPEAARQCYRPQAGKERNDDTYNQFMQAAGVLVKG